MTGVQTCALPISIMAPMLTALCLEPAQRVLEIGAGTGYNAALLKHLVGPRGRVTTVDLERAFALRARRSLASAGYAARVVVGDGRAGWRCTAPYDRIMVTAAAETVPEALVEQLAEGGVMVLPLGPHSGTQQLVKLTKCEQGIKQEDLIGVRFVPLLPGTGREL